MDYVVQSHSIIVVAEGNQLTSVFSTAKYFGGKIVGCKLDDKIRQGAFLIKKKGIAHQHFYKKGQGATFFEKHLTWTLQILSSHCSINLTFKHNWNGDSFVSSFFSNIALEASIKNMTASRPYVNPAWNGIKLK